jgi:putative ABC transport system permease protein
MLLIGAALMLRSFAKLRAVDAGFRTDNVLTMAVHLNFSTYTNADHQLNREKVLAFHQALEERVRGLPGVLAMGQAFAVPLDTTFQNNGSFRIEGRGDQGPFPRATYIGASHEYFTALNVPLVEGRGFGPHDGVTGDQVALVSQALARRHFKDGRAVGERISGNGRVWRTIVGVVGDVRQAGLDREPAEAIYLPFPEFPGFSSRILVRTAMDPVQAVTNVQSFVRTVDPQAAVSNVQTLEQVRRESLSSPRLTSSLLTMFAVVALAITAAGLSGLVAYSVSQRTHEIGIRMALGADRAAILRMVLREGLAPVMIGLGIGLLGALALSRFVGGLLFGLAPTDPLCFFGSALVLTLVAIAACLLPARRATSIHPLVALRAL